MNGDTTGFDSVGAEFDAYARDMKRWIVIGTVPLLIGVYATLAFVLFDLFRS